jgi:HAD superfamily hydrolase (TIGR01549 family)
LSRAESADNGIRGIVFDVDGTLYWQMPLRVYMGIMLLLHHLVKPRQLFLTVKAISAYRRAQEQLRRTKQQDGDCRQRQLALAASQSALPIVAVQDIIEEWFEKKPLAFIRYTRKRNLVSELRRLQQKGYTLGIFSDYPAENKLKALGLRDFFPVIVSCQDRDVNGYKPWTNGFDVIARKMGLDPHQIVYVGDRREVDVMGAGNAGMNAFLVKNGHRFEADEHMADNFNWDCLF